MFTFINVLLIIIFLVNCISNKTHNSIDSFESNSRNSSLQPKIAIIGCGVGGSSAAYFLNQLVSKSVSIDLFEKSSEVGGRLATQQINGKHYETGGSIIHDRNKYATDLVNKFGLFKRKLRSDSEQKICLFNGKYYEFCESSWKWITYLKIWLKYGFDANKLESKVSKIIDSFEKIYRLQEYNVNFDSVDDILDAMSPSINNLTKTSYKDYLFNNGFSKIFINQLVQAITLVNYGQDVSIPAFVGCVSFAGAGSQLWSIEGGNKLLPKMLAKNSNANLLLNTRVDEITYLGPNRFELSITPKSGQTYTEIYSNVIIGTPLTENQIKFTNFSVNFIQNIPKRKYHRTVSTLVAGYLNKKFRGKDVLSINKSNFFTSIGRVYPVDNINDEKIPVYKIFSASPLTTEQLNNIFEETKVVRIHDWFAYPEYESISQTLPSFVLYPGIYHLNAIEWAASAIEMSLIGGRNVAILTFNQLEGKSSDLFINNKSKKPLNDEL